MFSRVLLLFYYLFLLLILLYISGPLFSLYDEVIIIYK